METVANALVIAVALAFLVMLLMVLWRYGVPPEGVAERWRRIPMRSRVLFVASVLVYLAVGILLARST